MEINKHVTYYIDMWRNGEIILNRERELLIHWLEKEIFTRDDIYFDEHHIESCISFIEKWYFPLQPFQKFIIAFMFLLYKDKRQAFFNNFFITLGRGGGKNGLASGVSNYLISPLHGVKGYNVGIVATSEEQATVSTEEVYLAIDTHKPMQKFFTHGKARIWCSKTQSWFKHYTSNSNTKDGARLGAIWFDEIHQMENFKLFNVFKSGFGKRPYSRRIYMGTTGHVRDGAYDAIMQRAMDILEGRSDEKRFFPFVCKIDDIQEVDDPDMWQKANPMLHPPMCEYAEILFDEMLSDHRELKYGGDKIEFIVKRMNYTDIDSSSNVATKEEIKACNVPLPNLNGAPCVGGLDFASKKDFIACGLLFNKGDKWHWLSHSFVLKGFLDNYEIQAPIEDWSYPNDDRQPLLTIIDDVEIDTGVVVEWYVKMRERYDFDTIVIDNYRSQTIKRPLEEAGFNVVVIYKSRAYQAGIGLNIQTLFARNLLTWGINPLMNWYTYNVKVDRDAYDNIVYNKKERVRRKTDGFMAFTHAYWYANDNIITETEDFIFDDFWG